LKRDTTKDLLSDFEEKVKDMGMKTLLNEGVYRHLSFRKPGTTNYSFQITTWPGYLCISGDVGHFVFRRTHDMFDFFSGPISEGYYKEKCVAGDCESFNEDTWPELLQELLEEEKINQDEFDVLCCEHPTTYEEAYRALSFESADFDYEDIGCLTSYTYQFLWCLLAIDYAIKRFSQDSYE